MIPNSNDLEELKKVLKQHYKERKLYSKIVAKWNEEKEKEIKKDELFNDILDSDFLNFLFKEMNLNKINQNNTIEETFESKIISILQKDKNIECILSIPSKNISFLQKEDDITFDVYIKEKNIINFANNSNIESLKEEMNASFFKITNDKSFYKFYSFYISERIVTLRINNFSEIFQKMPYDIEILYNPLCINISILSKDEYLKKELEEIYSCFLFKIIEFLRLIREKEYNNCKILLISIVIDNLYNLIYILSKQMFSDINLFKHKKNELETLVEQIFTSKAIYTDQINYLNSLIDFLKQILDLTGVQIKDLDFENFHNEIKNLIK